MRGTAACRGHARTDNGARQFTADPDVDVTLGAGKGYDAAELIEELQRMKVTPHVAQNKSGRRWAVPDEIASSEGCSLSQRKLIDQGLGWAKLIGPICQVLVRGIKKVDQLFVLTMAVYNLARMRTFRQAAG